MIDVDEILYGMNALKVKDIFQFGPY